MATKDTENAPVDVKNLPAYATEQALQQLVDKVSRLEKKVAASVKKEIEQVKIYAHDEACFPTPDGNHGFDLKFDSDSPEPAIPPRMAFPLNCGFSVELPKGMRVMAQATEDWAKKGLVLSVNTYAEATERRQVSVIGYNVGRQILAFEHGQVLGKVWFVKVDQIALVSCK